MTDDGRRERKKLATRHALSTAALQLATERGLESVTIEDITARADVSLRTFRNYFASKHEAICAFAADRARQIGASLVERPADEPLWEALMNAVLQHYRGTEQAFGQEPMTAIRLIAVSPAIRGEYLKINAEMQDALAAALAERTGADPGADMYPQILAGAVTAATQVATRRWLRADPPEPLLPLLELALRELAAACSEPRASRHGLARKATVRTERRRCPLTNRRAARLPVPAGQAARDAQRCRQAHY